MTCVFGRVVLSTCACECHRAWTIGTFSMAREERFVHFQNRNFTVRGDIGFFFLFSPWFKGDAAFFTDSPSSSPFGSPVARKRVFTRTWLLIVVISERAGRSVDPTGRRGRAAGSRRGEVRRGRSKASKSAKLEAASVDGSALR